MNNTTFQIEDIVLELQIPDNIYSPLDDTELLAQIAIEQCSADVLEVGCGSGAISIALAKKNKCKKIVAVDINKDAIDASQSNAKLNGIDLEDENMRIRFLASDLFSNIENDEKFDWILFNPPYLPTADEDKVEGRLNLALDGGADGLDLVDKFLKSVNTHLKKDGVILMLVSSLQPEEKLHRLIKRSGFGFERLKKEKRFFFEKLFVYKLSHNRQ